MSSRHKFEYVQPLSCQKALRMLYLQGLYPDVDRVVDGVVGVTSGDVRQYSREMIDSFMWCNEFVFSEARKRRALRS